MNQLLNPYIKSEQIWICPSNSAAWVNVDRNGASDTEAVRRSYGGQNSYGVNQYAMTANDGPSIASFPETASTIALIDSRYYNVLPKGACRLQGAAFDPTTSSYPRYWKSMGNSFLFRYAGGAANEPSDAEAESLIKSRHLETLNTLYLDGHVKALNWTKVIADAPAVGKRDSQWDPFKNGC
jgi:prepilin-type processing-associated H-X9-DG protein